MTKIKQNFWRVKSFLLFFFQSITERKKNNHFIERILSAFKRWDISSHNFKKIEQVRDQLLGNPEIIETTDFGAGNKKSGGVSVSVKDIADRSLSRPWQCQALYRLGNELKSKNIIELGSSLGISTSYLASLNSGARVYTFEGSHLIAQYAKVVFHSLNLKNIELYEGGFEETLPSVLEIIPTVDLAFIDGNHNYEPTIKYFNMLLKKADKNSVFVLDDIYWSKDMQKAWKEIIARKDVTASIDFFKFGIVFMNPEASGHYKVFTKKIMDF